MVVRAVVVTRRCRLESSRSIGEMRAVSRRFVLFDCFIAVTATAAAAAFGSLPAVFLRDFERLGVLNELLVFDLVLEEDDCEWDSSGVEVIRVEAIGLLMATRRSMVSCSNCFNLNKRKAANEYEQSPSIGRMQWSTVQDSPLNEDVAVRIVVVLKLMSID